MEGYASTSFPGSLFSASIVVEKTTMETEKRDPGNEVGYAWESSWEAKFVECARM